MNTVNNCKTVKISNEVLKFKTTFGFIADIEAYFDLSLFKIITGIATEDFSLSLADLKYVINSALVDDSKFKDDESLSTVLEQVGYLDILTLTHELITLAFEPPATASKSKKK